MGGAAIAIGVGIQAYGTYQGLRASSVAAKYQAQLDRNNAELKRARQQDLRVAGARAAKGIETDTVQFIGEQVTAFASGNIDIASAVVTERVAETARTGAADIIELQHGIERDIWGLEIGILSDEASALMNKRKAKSAARLAPIAGIGAGVSAINPFLFRGTTPPPATQANPLIPRIK